MWVRLISSGVSHTLNDQLDTRNPLSPKMGLSATFQIKMEQI